MQRQNQSRAFIQGLLGAADFAHAGRKVYIEFPAGIGQGDMRPLFVIGPDGGSDLVNYRVHGNDMIVEAPPSSLVQFAPRRRPKANMETNHLASAN
jgi:hypothetical protein